MNQPTTITETEGEWAEAAAYAHDHIGDIETFPVEAYEHIASYNIEPDAIYRRYKDRIMDDFDRFVHSICGIAPRKEQP